jgi:hypothetical protein
MRAFLNLIGKCSTLEYFKDGFFASGSLLFILGFARPDVIPNFGIVHLEQGTQTSWVYSINHFSFRTDNITNHFKMNHCSEYSWSENLIYNM